MVRVSNMLVTPDSAKQVAVDAFEQMDEAEQQFLRETALILIRAHDQGEHHMPDFFKAQRLQQEEILALWSLLPSYVRSAIKRK